MKLPFVSRALLDMEHEARFREQIEIEWLRNRNDELRTANDLLTERLLSLKMAGAVEVPKPPLIPGTLAIAQEPDELRDLIDAKCGGNLQKRKMMLRQLAQDRMADVDEDRIRAAILNGVEGNGVAS